MLDLASLGAKVLHPRAVECAKEQQINIHVRSSFNKNKGTLVKEALNMEQGRPVTGITLKKDEAKLSILNVPDTPGIAGHIFSTLSSKNINVDMIIQSTEQNNTNTITFTVNQEDFDASKKALETLSSEIGASGIQSDDSIAKVSCVGVGMISKPGIAAKIFTILGDNKINIQLITTSEIKVSCAIDETDGERAVSLLHDAFELDNI